VNQSLFLFLLTLGAGYFFLRMIIKTRPTLSPEDARTAIASGAAVLVDVREPAEWQSGVADSAVLLPLSDLRGPRKNWQPFLDRHRGKRILLYCHSGARSGTAASVLTSEGFDAANLGGYSRWVASGLPVRRPGV
jgi:rhodanese-related sulfurtransferase